MSKREGKQYGASMLSQIASASKREDVEALLAKCTTFKGATPGTVRKWDRAARRRLDAIGGSNAKANPA